MKHLYVLILFAGLISACSKSPVELVPVADNLTLRTVEQGHLRGSITANGSHQWAGIPYAAAPVGDLRWRAPKSAAKWEDVFDALDAKIRCVQKSRQTDIEKAGQLVGTEDCLVLNVWAPAYDVDEVPTGEENDAALHPVMVFIHGGSNIWGFGGQYNSQALAKRHNMVMVSINYRMGPLGWFSQDALQDRQAGGMENSPNYANLDMIKALQWVRDNISAFGGNPEQVTIFGESAGGQNVAALLAIPQAQGLFKGAIIESGYYTSRSIADQQQGVDIKVGWHFMGDNTIVAKLHPPAGITGPELASFLRAQSPADIFAAAAWTDGEPESPLVIRDGILIPEQGLEYALSHSEHPIVPLITGTNRDELKLFNVANPDLTKKVFGFLPRARNKALYDSLAKHQSAMWRVRSVDDQARRISQKRDNPVFAYRFDWDEEGSFLGSDFAHLIGAAHAMELPFVFDGFATFPIGGGKIFPKSGVIERDELSKNMMSYWAEFAYNGDPGRGRDGSQPLWSRWSQAQTNGQLMILDTRSGGGIRMVQKTLDASKVYQQLGTETAHFDPDEKCLILQGVTGWYPDTKSLATQANISNC